MLTPTFGTTSRGIVTLCHYFLLCGILESRRAGSHHVVKAEADLDIEHNNGTHFNKQQRQGHQHTQPALVFYVSHSMVVTRTARINLSSITLSRQSVCITLFLLLTLRTRISQTRKQRRTGNSFVCPIRTCTSPRWLLRRSMFRKAARPTLPGVQMVHCIQTMLQIVRVIRPIVGFSPPPVRSISSRWKTSPVRRRL